MPSAALIQQHQRRHLRLVRNTVPTKEELDKRLEGYLDREEMAERLGYTRQALHGSLKTLTDWTTTHEAKDDARHSELANAIIEINKWRAAKDVADDARSRGLESIRVKAATIDTRVTQSSHDWSTEALQAQKIARDAEREEHARMVERVWKIALLVAGVVLAAYLGHVWK